VSSTLLQPERGICLTNQYHVAGLCLFACSFEFECVRLDDEGPFCFGSNYQPDHGTWEQGIWELRATEFASTGVAYEIRVTVRKTRGGRTRQSTASNVFFLSGNVVRGGQAKHDHHAHNACVGMVWLVEP